MRYGESWLDVISVENGSREIVFSTKNIDEAIDYANDLNEKGKQVYINANEITKQRIEREVIDMWNGYEPYETVIEEQEQQPKKRNKKKFDPKKAKKSYHF